MVDFIKKMFGREESQQDLSDETIFSAKIESEKQTVSALNMVGAGFESKGGSSLMLTEPVENGVDAIIKLNETKSKKIKGEIKVVIEQIPQRVVIIDNGTGFLRIKHVCEKPFDSLKEFDTSQIGKFARGLQGFRAFCNNLTYITKRLPEHIPNDEKDVLQQRQKISNDTAKIDFEASTNKVRVKYVETSEFNKYTKFEHGTVAIYENWKPGMFEKFSIRMLLDRLQHHFGELIRQGNISIMVEHWPGRIAEIGPEQMKFQEVKPKDYSEYTPITIAPVIYKNNGIQGAINFNLYLSDKGRTDRLNQPFLLYQSRPVGDGYISEIDEFNENPIWKHKFLTGYITCDFCKINELRQGLKINDERDFLFKELLKVAKVLEKMVKDHSKGLFELRFQKEVSELVKDLQLFFKAKNIFNFKIAKSTGFLSTENPEIEVVELAKTSGADANLEVPSEKGETIQVSVTSNLESAEVVPYDKGIDNTLNPNIGTHGGIDADHRVGTADRDAVKISGDDIPNKTEGFEKESNGYNQPQQETNKSESGGKTKNNRRATRHKPRGFGIAMVSDEFNEDLSWFDEVSSVVIINSLHPRYLSRSSNETQIKELLKYLAELYIWEITKLVHAKDEELQKGMKFLDYKFEYFEQGQTDNKEEVSINDSE